MTSRVIGNLSRNPAQEDKQANSGRQDLQQLLDAGTILVADGATGTLLMAAGLPNDTAPEEWNVERPEEILKLHRSYLGAGSQIILTNTFGGNRIKLGKRGIAGRVGELNEAGARLARQAGAAGAYVAGDIGPTGEMMSPLGDLTYEAALEVFLEQATALANGGVDAIWVETMTDLEEARAAVTAARQTTDLPVLCSLSFGPAGRTMMGVTARKAAEELWPIGLAAIGANCGEGLDVVEEALREMHEALPDAPLIAKPNAGLAKLIDGKTVYDVGPEDFSKRIGDFIALGARVVGSCCGSSPAYIRAIAEALSDADSARG